MKTLGIDLASKDRRTAACVIQWTPAGEAQLFEPVVDCSDERLIALARGAAWIAIDIPFGWPAAAVEAIHRWTTTDQWLNRDDSLGLRFRATDLVVQQRAGLWPLSVSSDRIAIPAWRGAYLLRALSAPPKTLDRIGYRHGPVEVYPAAALKLWGFDRRGYKTAGGAKRKKAQQSKRSDLVEDLARRASEAGWLSELPDAVRSACIRSDDALDALICSLMARAASTGLTAWPDAHQRALAKKEGWIHLPLPGSFDQLGDRQPLGRPLKKRGLPSWTDVG